MSRSLIITTAVLTLVLVITAGTAHFARTVDENCTLDGMVRCTDVTRNGNQLHFTLETEEPLTEVRVQLHANCGANTNVFLSAADATFTVAFPCGRPTEAVEGELSVLYDHNGERHAQIGTFSTR